MLLAPYSPQRILGTENERKQTFATTRNSQPRIFQSSLETEAGMVFSPPAGGEKERRFQNSPIATPGQADGTLKGCLVGKFPTIKGRDNIENNL